MSTHAIALILVACGSPETSPADAGAMEDMRTMPGIDLARDPNLCTADADCSNGVYCDGIERCAPRQPNADARGCLTASALPCMATQTCHEATRVCETRCAVTSDADADGARAAACGGNDCDDADALRYPGAREVCDADDRDEDCDATTFGFRDIDGDGFSAASCCNGRGSARVCGTDCDDMNEIRHPTEAEVCDTLDNDCDERVDENVVGTFYRDIDGDGFGAADAGTQSGCFAPTGFVADDTDCDDTTRGKNPGLGEVCDGLGDNDCDGSRNPFDQDRDGRDNAACGGTDCNDSDALVFVGAVELCNGRDDDCSGDDAATTERDVDGDGFIASTECIATATLAPGDCNDSYRGIHVGAVERCNARDDDCDGMIDDGLVGCDPIIDFALHRSHGCVVRRSGVVRCWGANYAGEVGVSPDTSPSSPVSISDIGDATMIVTGDRHTCALRRSGRVACWGANASHELGNGSTTPSYVPVEVTGVTTATSIVAGGKHTCALLMDKTIVCWGENGVGQLGDSTRVQRSTLSAVPLSNVESIAAAGDHTCALLANRDVYCWGSPGGALGAASSAFASEPTPIRLAGVSNAERVFAGTTSTCALVADGATRCVGSRANTLGTGSTDFAAQLVPLPIFDLTAPTDVALGAEFGCAITNVGGGVCWGTGFLGEIGDGSASSRLVGVPIASTSELLAVRAGPAQACALEHDGDLVCWGSNEDGALPGDSARLLSPTEIPGFFGARDLSLDTLSCAALGDGTVRCGGGSASNPVLPTRAITEVAGVSDAVRVWAGSVVTCALRQNGSLSCWGFNAGNQLAPDRTSEYLGPTVITDGGMPITNATGVAFDSQALLIMRSDGTILRKGSSSSCNIPSDVLAVSSLCYLRPDHTIDCCGASHDDDDTLTGVEAFDHNGQGNVCGVLGSGEVWCWGVPTDGALGNQMTGTPRTNRPVRVTGIADATSVAVGTAHACALRSDGRVACWGRNRYGQLGRGYRRANLLVENVPGLDGVVAIDAYLDTTCARRQNGSVLCWGDDSNRSLGIEAPGIARTTPTAVVFAP